MSEPSVDLEATVTVLADGRAIATRTIQLWRSSPWRYEARYFIPVYIIQGAFLETEVTVRGTVDGRPFYRSERKPVR